MSLLDDLLATPAGLVSGRRCQEHVAHLSRIHRIIGTPGYHAAIEYARGQLEALGVPEIAVERFPLDGERAYGDWVAPVAWSPRRAELWVESPSRLRLCDYAEMPICLHVGSQATPPGGIEGDLIDIGGGLSAADYGGRDVRGQIVLTSGNVREVYEEAVRRRGARGILCDGMPWQAPAIGRSPLDQPDLVSYNKLNVRRAEVGSGVFGFSLSARQGAALRQMLRQGAVRVRSIVDATAGAGEMEILSARIPGSESPAEETVLIAHLCHPQPGANDNATGPALVLEMVRALLAAQNAGRLPRLRRSLRILFVPEAYGTIAWLLESAQPRGSMGWALNLDMVGGDSSQTRGHLWLDQTPWSVPSFLNDLVAALLAAVPAEGWQYGVREHMGGSDHILFLAPEIGVPALMLGHEPDRFYHSDQDTVDKTSPQEFERVGLVALAALLAVDGMTLRHARALAHVVYQGARQRLIGQGQRIVQEALAGEWPQGGDYDTPLRIALAREQDALRSLLPYVPASDQSAVRAEVEVLARRLDEACLSEKTLLQETIGPSLPRPAWARQDQIPQRLFRGPISSHLMGISRFLEGLGTVGAFYRARSQEDRSFVRWMFEASNLIDGRRTLRLIQDTLAAEFGPRHAREEDLLRFVDDLVAVGMARIVA